MKLIDKLKKLLEKTEDEWEEYDIDNSEVSEDTWLVDDSPFDPEVDILERVVTVIRNGKRLRKTLKIKKKRVITGKERAGRRKAARKLKRTLKKSSVKMKRKKSLKKRKAQGLKRTKNRSKFRISN